MPYKLASVLGLFVMASARSLFADETGIERPSCKALEEVYIAIAEAAGEKVSETELQAAIYSENPTDAECAAMLAMFPEMPQSN